MPGHVLILRRRYQHHVPEQPEPVGVVRQPVQVAVLDLRAVPEGNLGKALGLRVDRAGAAQSELKRGGFPEPESVPALGRVRDGHLTADVPEVGTGDGQKQVQAWKVWRHRRVRQSRADDENADGMRGE